jgi:hypothetical protein
VPTSKLIPFPTNHLQHMTMSLLAVLAFGVCSQAEQLREAAGKKQSLACAVASSSAKLQGDALTSSKYSCTQLLLLSARLACEVHYSMLTL